MADNNELQTSRITVDSAGSAVDNAFRNVEAALRTIFGVTADADYSEAMQIGSGPDITMTGSLTMAADPVEDLEVATKQYADNIPGSSASVRCAVVLSSGQTVNSGNTDALGWDAAEIEEGGDCWAIGAPTRIVFPVAGDYMIGGAILAAPAAAAPNFEILMKYNGSVWVYDHLAFGKNSQTGGGVWASANFAVLETFALSDYIEIFLKANSNNHVVDVDSRVWIMKVG